MRISALRGGRAWLALTLLALVGAHPVGIEAAEISISRQLGILYLPVQVMEAQQLVEKHAAAQHLDGVSVKWLTFTSGGAQTDALLSGNVDIVNTGTGNLLLLWDRTHGAIKGVVASSAQPLLMVTRDPAKKTLQDFGAGDKIAVPTVKVSTQAILLQLAASKLYGPEQWSHFDPMTVQLGHVDAMTALAAASNEVATHFSAPPYQYLEIKSGGHVLTGSMEIMGGPLTQGQFFTRADYAEKNPALIRALRDANDDAIAFIKDQPREAVEIYRRLSNDKTDTDELLALLKEPNMMDFVTKPQGTMKFAEHLHRVGLIKTMPKAWTDYYLPGSADLQGN